MLILTRRVNQDILIGDSIVIKVCEVDKLTGKVKIGIEAPKSMSVDRREVRERQDREDDDFASK